MVRIRLSNDEELRFIVGLCGLVLTFGAIADALRSFSSVEVVATSNRFEVEQEESHRDS